MRTNVRFRTSKFQSPGNSGEPFPGIELAEWLIEQLKNDFSLDYIDEDYYCILYIGDPAIRKLRGACGRVEEDVWQILMQLNPSLLDKLLKRSMPNELHKEFILRLDDLYG